MISFKEISPSEFFYQHRELAGFSNPARALYSAIRELIENSLDACDGYGILPDVLIRITETEPSPSDIKEFEIYIKDNGIGIPPERLPRALGKVFYGSKFTLKQSRGTFGMGGTMSILYAQITTNKPLRVWSNTGNGETHYFELMIDIENNKPMVLKHKKFYPENWRGTAIKINMLGDYVRSSQKIQEYFRRLALFTPYANIVFEDPNGEVFAFKRSVDKVPPPPREVQPHPKGVDLELLRRVVQRSTSKTALSLLTNSFQRVGRKTALEILKMANVDPNKRPSELKMEEMMSLINAMKTYEKFLPPDPSCLSPLGKELIEEGIKKELNPQFVYALSRKPSSYEGYPFIVEAAVASDKTPGIKVLRYANRIPLLYDEKSDVVWKLLNEEIDLKRYKIDEDEPVIILTHVCSTKVPYKTVGKEFVADIPEVEKEMKLALQKVLREYSLFIGKKVKIEAQKKKKNVYELYLPMIAKFAALLGETKTPNVSELIDSVKVVDIE
ncbi:MAG: DNA topoisomerase VI subunit B [Nitrososphaeria archaeon]|jgi:DNA topoisomerase-6 subunit B